MSRGVVAVRCCSRSRAHDDIFYLPIVGSSIKRVRRQPPVRGGAWRELPGLNLEEIGRAIAKRWGFHEQLDR